MRLSILGQPVNLLPVVAIDPLELHSACDRQAMRTLRRDAEEAGERRLLERFLWPPQLTGDGWRGGFARAEAKPREEIARGRGGRRGGVAKARAAWEARRGGEAIPPSFLPNKEAFPFFGRWSKRDPSQWAGPSNEPASLLIKNV